jgi:recombination protein RecA
MAKKAPEQISIDLLRKKFGNDAALLLSEGGLEIDSVTPTGITVLDRFVLGIGGLPRGRIVEVYGPEGSGKTTLADKIMAGHQSDGGVVYLNDVENKFDPKWAALHGVQTDKVVLMQNAEAAEQWLEQLEMLLTSGPDVPMCFVLDSVADIKVMREIEEGVMGDAAMAEHARVWSGKLRIIKPLIRKRKALVVCLNQIRSKPGVMYGPKETTPGGNALKFAYTTRLEVHHGTHVKDGPATVGRLMHVKAVKHQVSPPFRSVTLRLNFLDGFDDRWSVLDHAKEVGCVDKRCRSFKEAAKNLGWDDLLDKHKGATDELAADPREKDKDK